MTSLINIYKVGQLLLSWSFIPLAAILVYLLLTRHAGLGAHGTSACSACGDERVFRSSVTFGGASAFTMGWHWAILAIIFGLDNWVGKFFASYALLQAIMTLIQTATFILTAGAAKEGGVIRLKSHIQGCGYVTAWGPLWWLFWLQKLPGLSWLVIVRDGLTVIDYVVSLPWMIVLNVLSLIFHQAFTIPLISNVDDPHPHQ